MNGREVGIAVVAVAVVDVAADGNVAATVAEAAIQLSLRAEVLVGAVSQRFALAPVHDEVLIVQPLDTFIAEGIGDVVEGIGVERGVV